MKVRFFLTSSFKLAKKTGHATFTPKHAHVPVKDNPMKSRTAAENHATTAVLIDEYFTGYRRTS
jgi:hypothetical protein